MRCEVPFAINKLKMVRKHSFFAVQNSMKNLIGLRQDYEAITLKSQISITFSSGPWGIFFQVNFFFNFDLWILWFT